MPRPSQLLRACGALALLLLLSASAGAQRRVQILDSGKLYATYNLRGDASAMRAVRDAVGALGEDRVVERATESAWPSGINSFEGWQRNQHRFVNFVAYEIASFGDKSLLRIPADENRSLPADLRPSEDIYFVMARDGIAGTDPSGRVPVRITNVGDLYATYDLRGSGAAMDALRGLAAPDAETVLRHAHQDGWPAAIATFERRQAGTRDRIADYVTYYLTEFEDEDVADDRRRLVLVAPRLENQGMPPELRPDTDLFFVIKESGVAIGTPSGGALAPAAATARGARVQIIDSGTLYSTFNFDVEPDFVAAIRAALPPAQADYALAHAHERTWPSGIDSFADWQANKYRFGDYTGYVVASSSDRRLVHIPADENRSLPADLRPSEDIYFVMGAAGLAPADARGRAAVRLDDPGQLYTTYALRTSDAAMGALRGQTRYAVETVLRQAHERAWPAGIATFGARDRGTRPLMRDYVLYHVATFLDTDDTARHVLVAPAAENGHMQPDMRPAEDLFFVVKHDGVTLGARAR